MQTLTEILQRKIIFVSGKGGVGKSVVARALALALSKNGRRTLWVEFEDPLRPPGELRKKGPRLWHLNCDAQTAFEQYAKMKIGDSPIAKLFIENKLMRYLAKAAPGIHELVLLGKIWHERTHYDSIVVDMPSTGHGLAMFQSTKNFALLFRGGPIHHDAEAMIETFADPHQTGHLIVALPEEMPLQEGLELDQFLTDLFPDNPAAFLVNRLFPRNDTRPLENPADWPSPVPKDSEDYIEKRCALERHNLRIWKDKNISFAELEFIAPPLTQAQETISATLSQTITERYLQ